MSHRNGLPKPSASLRTLRRFRLRNDIETEDDKKHMVLINEIKEKARLGIDGLKSKLGVD